MDIFDEKDIERYNENKLQKMQDKLELLREKVESCEIKNPILNNGYHVCPCEVYCNR